MTDHEMWDGNSQCNGNGSLSKGNFDPVCVEKLMICSLDYLNKASNASFTCALDGLNFTGSGLFADTHYWKVSGRPVLSYFMAEGDYFGTKCTSSSPCAVYNDNQSGTTCTNSSQCWQDIFQGIGHHISGFSTVPYIIHQNTFSHAAPNNGSYRWFNPSTDQSYQNLGPDPHTPSVDTRGYDGWLNDAFSTTLPVVLAVGYGKVDHAESPFGSESGPPYGTQADHLIMDAQCGKTWLATLGEPHIKGFGTSHPLQALEIATWDDYDEGTEMETGIDNCVSSFTESLNGQTLSWSIRFTAPGDESTIDHYTIFYSSDGSTGQNLRSVANVAVNPANNGNYSFTLPNLPSTTVLSVKAVGKSMIRNHMTSGVTCTTCGNATPGAGLHHLFFNGCIWQDQPVVVTTPVASPNGISSYAFSDGQHAYFLNFNQHLLMAYFSGGTWQAQDVTAMTGGPSVSSTSGISSYSFSDGQHIYFVGTDQHVHMAYFNNTTWLDQDVTVMTGGPLPSFSSAISSYAFSDGQHVYFVASGNQHVHMAYFNNTAWLDQDVTVMTGGPSASSTTGITSYAFSDGQHVFFVGSDQHVHMAYFNNTAWLDQDVTVMTGGPLASSTPGITSYAFSDGQHVFFVGSDQHVHMAYFNNTIWLDQDVTVMSGGPSASSTTGITSYAFSDGQHVHFVGSDQHVHTAFYNNTAFLDLDLTSSTGGPSVTSGSGISSYVSLDGQHVYYLSN